MIQDTIEMFCAEVKILSLIKGKQLTKLEVDTAVNVEGQSNAALVAELNDSYIPLYEKRVLAKPLKACLHEFEFKSALHAN